MALEGLAKTSHATLVEASPDLSTQAGRKPSAPEHGAAGGPKAAVASGLCRFGAEKGSERAWLGSGFFILAML
jgi:hypothetical protein